MKIKFILIIFLSYTGLYADFIELYRLKGIDAVKNEFNKIIKTKEYWNKYLKNIDVQYGYYESINYILVCNKNLKQLSLYNKQNKQLVEKFSSSIFIGKENGDKEKEGDLKTPIGVYRLTQKLTKLDPFYGPLALVTSYPNLYDKVNHKSGGGIWIHGVPFDEKRDNFTKGCIALDNNKLQLLNSEINYKNAILLLNENKINFITKEDISNILYQIFIWRDAWQSGDIEKYLSFYDINFKQTNGTNLENFKIRKTRIFKRAKDKKIKLTKINISPFLNKNGTLLFRIIMDEDYKAKYYKFKGTKELYVYLNNDNKMLILTEG